MYLNNNIIDLAVKEALKSQCHHKIGAVIFKGSKIISSGHNYALKSVKHLRPKFQKWPGSVHAEVDAIIRARTDLRRTSIVVVRVNNSNKFLLSKPCKWCMSYIEHVGLKNIYYSVPYYPYIIHT